MSRKLDKDRKCNDQVIADTIAATGESKQAIEHAIHHLTSFIGRKIEEGTYETIRVPYFGSFIAKHNSVQWRELMMSLPESYRNIIRNK